MTRTSRILGFLLIGAGTCLAAGPAASRVFASAPPGGQEQVPSRREFDVTATNYHFTPDRVEVKQDELVKLNRRVVERLQFIRSAKTLTQLARFSVGMAVEFDSDDGRTISGTVARLNQKTATVVSAAGRWRVSPSLLRPASVAQESAAASRIVAMPRRRQS